MTVQESAEFYFRSEHNQTESKATATLSEKLYLFAKHEPL